MQSSNSVTTVSIAVSVFSIISSIPMLLWVINFYRLRKCREIASRRPKSSLLAGVLCTFGNMIVWPTILLYLNIESTPYIPWLATFLQLGVMFSINAPYHIFTYRAYMVYFDIKFNELLQDRKWRLYIDPQETNWYLKHRDSWGNQKRIAFILFTHWLIFAIAVVIGTILNGDKANTFTRLLFGVNGCNCMLVDIYLYVNFPTFNDSWGVHNEIKLTLRIEIFQQIVYYILILALKMDYYTMPFVYTFIFCFVGSFLFTYSIHLKVFRDSHLPSWPCCGSTYTETREHLNLLTAESPSIATCSIPDSDEDINRKERQKLTLHQVLQDTLGFNEFARHLTKEFSVENLLFFVEILQWEKSLRRRKEYVSFDASVWMDIKLPETAPISRIIQLSDAAVKEVHDEPKTECKTECISIEPSTEEYLQAIHLFKKYIPNSAYFALNISAKQRYAIYQQFLYNDSMQATEEDMIRTLKDDGAMDRKTLIGVFDDIRGETWLLLKYAFIRFRDSDEFTKISQAIMESLQFKI